MLEPTNYETDYSRVHTVSKPFLIRIYLNTD